jgi:hypothetical protein
MDLFKAAAQVKLRFKSTSTPSGLLTTEDLYDLPLTSDKKTSLESLAQSVNRKLKDAEVESFVSTASKGSNEDTLRLDILKCVIAQKIEANLQVRASADKKQKKATLLHLLDQKQNEALGNLSEKEILAQIEALG